MPAHFLRWFFIATGLFYLLFAIGYTLRMPQVVSLWMWADTRLSFIFIGSICAALATGSLWVGFTGRWRAAIPSLAGLGMVFVLSAAFLWYLYLSGSQPGILLHTLGYSVAAIVAVAMVIRLAREAPDVQPLMRLVRWSCAVFAVALVLAGAGLATRYGTIFPWPLSPESSTLFGLTFLGLSIIYALTAVRGGWAAGMVAMSGFLVYDLVLLPPFLMHFSTVAPERMTSLVLYTAVLVYSAAVAIYFLLTDGRQAPREA